MSAGDQDERSKAMAEQPGGLSVRVLATVLGVSPSTAHRYIVENRELPAEDGTITVGKTMGTDGKLRPNRRFDTTERDRLILDMRAEGSSVRAVAEAVGCSVGTVHRIVKRG